MEQKTRIRINLSTREVEWEGSESFIAKYDTLIGEYMEKIKEEPARVQTIQASTALSVVKQVDSIPQAQQSTGLPDTFGEYYTGFPRNIKVVDKMLIAAYYVQQKSSDGFFTIKEAADLLNEQNVLVTNANAFVKSLANTGKLFKNSGKYKVSERGIEAIKQLNAQ